ncbi:MarR family winged helix-turn-helix transcriptional regulator [Flexithrix dorotheae]|uniref:MarR family winged helix-turn-helix transcriptional regulator n=1 Tax=Flexithrix dorotheae TaxID=70993 RepID=UPI00037969E0|nr:MarR family transcriptional regulator [Flexithrix dorotheae]
MANIEEEIKSKFISIKHKAVINVVFTANWINSESNNILRPFGISIQQFNILRILRGSKGTPLSVQTIKERMVERAPNITRLMDKLLEKELIGRVRCEHDRRVVFIEIMPEGLKLLSKLDEIFPQSNQMVDNITEKEAEELNRILNKLRG